MLKYKIKDKDTKITAKKCYEIGYFLFNISIFTNNNFEIIIDLSHPQNST